MIIIFMPTYHLLTYARLNTKLLSLPAGVHVQLQKTPLDEQNHPLKPNMWLIEKEDKWQSLAASLYLAESEIERVKTFSPKTWPFR